MGSVDNKQAKNIALLYSWFKGLGRFSSFFNTCTHECRYFTLRCKILDKHLNVLAKRHIETKFCKINAEKCPFLCDRLKIKVNPNTPRVVGLRKLDN